ncbi:glycosyltransferase family 2 protein [Roseicella aerolata]|uniref:Glycosyltransferase family 2 protein n=1 Tax=Roseicella aerolata TaxID=2883479 RepID=A0A9X1IJ68_9PROT|nr:glycosyltransferase family A protein [Roseicella aerolata]MCB4825121.1 glycosyltransferase family 2 protein [Roseicella aerolata]
MAPDISIVIPAYNVAGYIVPTLRSALAQRDVATEIIVVDDGSNDATPRILEGFRAEPRLRVIRQLNQGLPAARNTGLAAAVGRHVGFLDGDDLWDPVKARRHVDLLDRRPEIDLTYSWWRIIDDAGEVTGRHNTEPPERLLGGLSFEGLAIENFAGNGSTVVCRREALLRAGGFDPALRACEDLDAWLRVALLREGNIALVEEILTSYRMRGGQMTRDWQRMLQGWEAAIGKARLRAPDRIAAVERMAMARRNRFLAYIAYEAGDHAAARGFILGAWRASPRALLGDRRCWLVSSAVAVASVLPRGLHEGLAATVKRHRAERARLRATSAA